MTDEVTKEQEDTYPAYVLLETLINLRKSYICKDQEEE